MTLWQRILRALEVGFEAVLGRARERGDKSEAFTIGVIALGAKLSKADGQVTRDEVRAFREVFHVPEDQHENVGMLFNLARQDVAGFDGYARRIARLFDPRSPELERLMACLFHIASADGEVSPPELDFLAYVADIFGWSAAEFERLALIYRQDLEDDPFSFSGGTRRDWETIRKARNSLVYERDQLASLGLPDELWRCRQATRPDQCGFLPAERPLHRPALGRGLAPAEGRMVALTPGLVKIRAPETGCRVTPGGRPGDSAQSKPPPALRCRW